MYIPGWISHRSGSTWVFVTDSGPCVDGKVIILFSLSVLMFHVHLCNDGWEWESSIARPLRCAAFHAHRDIYFHGREMGHTIQRSMTCAITREPKIEVKARLNGNHKILNSSFFESWKKKVAKKPKKFPIIWSSWTFIFFRQIWSKWLLSYRAFCRKIFASREHTIWVATDSTHSRLLWQFEGHHWIRLTSQTGVIHYAYPASAAFSFIDVWPAFEKTKT